MRRITTLQDPAFIAATCNSDIFLDPDSSFLEEFDTDWDGV